MKIIKDLKKWLTRPENTKAKIAAFMGYSSSETVSRWIERGRVPVHQQERLNSFLKGGRDVSTKSSQQR